MAEVNIRSTSSSNTFDLTHFIQIDLEHKDIGTLLEKGILEVSLMYAPIQIKIRLKEDKEKPLN